MCYLKTNQIIESEVQTLNYNLLKKVAYRTNLFSISNIGEKRSWISCQTWIFQRKYSFSTFWGLCITYNSFWNIFNFVQKSCILGPPSLPHLKKSTNSITWLTLVYFVIAIALDLFFKIRFKNTSHSLMSTVMFSRKVGHTVYIRIVSS